MTPPIDPQELQKVLEALPGRHDDPFPHIAWLTPDRLLQRRVELARIVKDQIRSIQKDAQVSGNATELGTAFLVLTQAEF